MNHLTASLTNLKKEDVSLGLTSISPLNAHLHGDLLKRVYSFRHEVFIKRENYAVYDVEQMEFDNYDRPNTVYLVKSHGQQILGVLRLNPTHLPYMIQDLWPHLVTDKDDMPKSEDVWECSRWSMQRGLDPELRQRIFFEFMLGLLEFSSEQSIRCLVALTYKFIWNQIKLAGWPPTLLGPTCKLSNHCDVQAGRIPVGKQLLEKIRSIAGIQTPVLLNNN